VVAFLLGERNRRGADDTLDLLEVACGTGNNLWFAAREGFEVAGIDGSPSAIGYARRRFQEDRLAGDLRVGEVTQLPWEDERFDLVVDRAGLTYSSLSAVKHALGEVHRVLRPGGRLLFTPYSHRHGSALSGREGPDGLRVGIEHGALAGPAPVCLYDRARISEVLSEGWELVRVQHVESTLEDGPETERQAEWRVVAERR